MLTRPLHHIRSNCVAYLALFMSVGGTSYAALGVPAGSVGARQIRNHSITAVKLNAGSIAGSIRHWAKVDAQGKLIAASPRAQSFGAGAGGAAVSWHDAISPKCMAFATVELRAGTPESAASATPMVIPGPHGTSAVQVITYDAQGAPSPLPFDVMVVCR